MPLDQFRAVLILLGFTFITWQFGLNGLEDVLSVVHERDFWEKLSLFLNPSDLLEDKTPLEVLHNGEKIEEVIQAAKAYGEHGA